MVLEDKASSRHSSDIELSVVVPIFNELDSIPPFVESVRPLLDGQTPTWEILFVADPCTDGSEDLMFELAKQDTRIKVIVMTRRFGQPMATLAGVELARGQAVIVMDVDLQDPPEILPEMIAKWREGAPLVLAKRRSRSGESRIRIAVASGAYAFLNRFSEVPIPKDTGDFRLMDRSIVEKLKQFPEANGFLRGLVALIGYEPAIVYFDREERKFGQTKYNRYTGSLKIGTNGLVGFSTALLSLSTILGLSSAALAIVMALSYLTAKLLGFPFPAGNPTLAILILLMGGMILMCLGILGIYVGRIYEEVRRRPRYMISTSINV